jgi:2-amino-4-hydroxy-6-hydroxymethyldihydropteridine diphosphokinase
MTVCYVAAGSNLGNRRDMLRMAAERLASNRWITLRRKSAEYETDPVGFLPQGRFLNAVWEFETDLPPNAFFEELRRTETFLGRQRRIVCGPRTIDLDLLAFGDRLLQSGELILPHPRLHERYFVLKPLSDINPGWMHPRFHRTARELLSELGMRR